MAEGGRLSMLSDVNKPNPKMATPPGLRHMVQQYSDDEREFAGFQEEETMAMKRVLTVEKEMICLRELIAVILKENEELKDRVTTCENVMKENNEMKTEMETIKLKNENLTTKCKQ